MKSKKGNNKNNKNTYNCCFLGFFLGLTSICGGSGGSCFIGGESGSPVPRPGDEVAEMVVEPPDDWPPPLPRDSGLFGGEGGDEGVTTFKLDNRGVKFF